MKPKRFPSERVAVLVPNRLAMALTGALSLAGIGSSLGALALGSPEPLKWGMPLLMFGLIGMLWTRQSLLFAHASRGDVSASQQGLALAGRTLASGQRLTAGLVGVMGGEVRVVLGRRWRGPLVLRVNSMPTGHALLSALGLAPGQRVVQLRLPSLLQSYRFGILLFMAGLYLAVFAGIAVTMAVGPYLGVPVALVIAALVAAPTWLAVGADGLRLRWGFVNKWIAFEQIRAFEADVRETGGRSATYGVQVALKSGRTLRLGEPRLSHGRLETHASHPVVEYVSAAMDLWLESSVPPLALPERGTSSTEEWTRKLTGLDDTAAYRGRGLDRHELIELVEAPRAPVATRAAAAVALSRGLEPDERTRIRLAARSTASPALRQLLTAVDQDSDTSELARALGKVDDE